VRLGAPISEPMPVPESASTRSLDGAFDPCLARCSTGSRAGGIRIDIYMGTKVRAARAWPCQVRIRWADDR
jgi:hypothetical protein